MIAYQFPYIFTKKNCIPVSDVTHNYLLVGVRFWKKA
jgi:hypothetical protein